MGDSNAFRDSRTEDQVRNENTELFKEIVSHCSRDDYKKHNVLLIGQTGSGKSSIINTLLKVIIKKYLPRAKAGEAWEGHTVQSNTMSLTRYPNCAAKETDFPKRRYDNMEEADAANGDSFRDILHKLPDIFDAAGMANVNSEEAKEVLKLLIGGFIEPSVKFEKLFELQKKKGLGYLPLAFDKSHDEYKISMVLFACECGLPIPATLIQCVRDVINEVDSDSLWKTGDSDVFVLLTKYDMVIRDNPSAATSNTYRRGESLASEEATRARPHITLDELRKTEDDTAKAFVITGMTDHTRLHWASYNTSIGEDNLYVDNNSLRLLRFLTAPLHVDVHVPVNCQNSWFHNFKVEVLFKWRQIRSQNVQISMTQLLLILAVLAVFLGIVYMALSSSASNSRRNV